MTTTTTTTTTIYLSIDLLTRRPNHLEYRKTLKYEVLGPAVFQKAPLESPERPRQGQKSGLEDANNPPKRPLESLLAIME